MDNNSCWKVLKMVEKCFSCGGEMEKERIKLRFGDSYAEVEGLRCEKCGETLLDPEKVQRILALNKLMKN